jgi:aspartate carbamoyltransferase catalytic subunit
MECLEIALHPLPVKRKFEIVLHLLPLKGELCSSFMSLASQRRSFAIVSHLLPLNRKALNGFT